ncbi:MAG: glycosyltransferase family 4 protein [Phycisphaerales bacterium]|nr:glycosyltransferase family 4 protein [Phycisphaerales bacterium]
MNVCILGDARSIHLQRNLSGLAQLGLDVTLLTHNPALIPGVRVERFTIPALSWRYSGRWRHRWRRYLIECLQHFDVVNVQFLHDWGFTADILERGCLVATPWGSDIHAPPGEDAPTETLIEARMRLLQHAGLVTAWGPTFAKHVAQFADLSPDAIAIIPLGVDTNLFDPRRYAASAAVCHASSPGRSAPAARADAEEASLAQYRVGFMKGFRRVYGPLDFLRAMAGVLKTLPCVRCTLIGDGPDLPTCRQLAVDLEIDHALEWMPSQAHASLPSIMATWDLSIMASACESFGVAALESAAMQVPVIATDVGGVRDAVIHNATGLLVGPPGRPEALTRGMIRMLSDPEARRQMGVKGRDRVMQDFEQRKMLQLWAEAYDKALEMRSVMV